MEWLRRKRRQIPAVLPVIRWAIMINIILMSGSSYGQAVSAQARVKEYNIESGQPAISGYDPVGYFNQNKAIKGNTAYTLKHEGITYRFASAANLETFRREPGRYEPQYGGWCAYAMGNDGSKVEVDPATFRILDGKLYLFYNSLFNNTLKTWLKNESALKTKADQHWARFIK